MNNKIVIDTLRGIACILLVAFHVIGSEPSNGLKISSGFYREVNDIFTYVRMPLFTFLSGLVYAYRPFKMGVQDFLVKKGRRLLLPMLTVGSFFGILQSLMPGTNNIIENIYLMHIIPVGHFWFIESLFILFALICVLEKIKVFDKLFSWIVVLFLSSILYISPAHYEYFSFNGFIYMFPYFLLGMGMYRYDFIGKYNKFFVFVLLLITLSVYLVVYLKYIPFFDTRSSFALLLGFISCVCMLMLGFKSCLIAKIGGYSYSIYLFHVFFTSGSRIILLKIGLINIETIFIICLVLGLIGPVFVEVLFSKYGVSKFLFLGKKY